MRIMHVDLKNKYSYSMWSEGKYLLTKKPARGTQYWEGASPCVRGKLVTLAPNIAHVHSHSGTPRRRVPHQVPKLQRRNRQFSLQTTGRPYFFRKGVLAYALVRKRYSLLIHHFFMSSFYIYEGMKVATLVATLRLRIMYMILKIVLKILCSMWVKYTMKFDFKNCILVQNSSKMF